MRVVVADDSMLLREGLVRLLTEAGCEVVASVADVDGFHRRSRRAPPSCWWPGGLTRWRR